MRGARVRLTIALAGALILAGCAAEPVDIDPAVSDELSTSVVQIADVAAAGDYVTALGRLDELEARASTAAGDGSITAARLVALQDAIERVRADLQGIQAAAEQAAADQAAVDAAAAAAAEQARIAAQAEADRLAAEQAAAEQEAENDAPVGPGQNNGNGKNEEKDKGKGKD